MTTGEALRVLGLPSRVRWEEIRLAYLDLVRVWHPDRFQSDPALQSRAAKRLAEINEAYDFLSEVHAARRNASNSPRRSTPQASRTPPSTAEPPSPHSPHNTGAPQPRPEPPPQPISDAAEQNVRRVTLGVIAAVALAVVVGFVLGPQESVAPSSNVGTPDPILAALDAVRAQPPAAPVPPFDPAKPFTLAPEAPPIGADVTALVEPPAAPVSSPTAQMAVAVYSQTAPGVDRPMSGAELIEGASDTGLGTLNVRNGTGRDAVVILYEGNLQRRAVYIRTRTAAAIPKVGAGTYTVRFMSGAWWNGEEFLQETTFSEFERRLEFEETTEADGIAYSDFELTLQPVVGGNARTRTTTPFKLSDQISLDGR